MSNKNYVSLARLSDFLDNIKAKYSQIGHKHTISDLTDYKLDTSLSSTSNNPIANSAVDAEFEAVSQAMGALDLALDGKSDTTHKHDDLYDKKGAAKEVSDTLKEHTDNTDIHVTTSNKSNWNSAYTHSQSTHARTDATKVEMSRTNGNILINGVETSVYNHRVSGVTPGRYTNVTVDSAGHVVDGSNPTTLKGYGITDAETKSDASAKLTEAKTYTDQSLVAYAKTADLGALAKKDSLTAADVGALPNTTVIPDALADLTADSTHRTVTDTEKSAWNAKANTSDIPTKVSQLTNDSKYLTSYTETDPTVPAWAKASTKPSYTKSEVGLGNVDNVKQYSANNPPVVVQDTAPSDTSVLWVDTSDDYSDSTPDYVKTEADAVIERIIAAQGNRTFTFAAITDLHYGNSGYTDGIIHACQAMKYIDQRIKLDAVAVLGDYTDGYPASGLTNAFNDFMGINSILDELRFAPNLRQQGNHDYYKDNFPVTHRFIQAYSNDVVWGNKTGGYYYKDFDDYKLRVISLNTVEEANDNLDCSAEQYQWFADSLDLSSKDDVDDWQILILSHHPIDWYTNDTGSNYWYRLPRVVKGYMKGLSSESYGDNFTPTFDFSKGNNRASIICNIHGHIHNLLMAPIYYDTGNTAAGNVGVYRLATPNACYNRENQYDGIWKETQSYPKTQDTAKDTAFVVYCIDLDEMKINAICYGAGYDRVYSYSNKHTIQYHLTNVSSSNNITTIKNGYTYSTTLTPAGTNMDSITVLMDGVDVTESVYSNGSITISSVTGDVVIMAASIVNLLDTVGYTNDMRFSASSGTEKTDAGCFATGYIDISDLYWDDQYYIWGAELENATASLSGKCVIVTYDENKTIMGYSYINHDSPLSNIKCQFTDNGALYIIRNGTPIPHYIRISGIGSGANVVVTKNQLPITDAGYTNLLLEAIDTDKTPYNGGQYYKSNYRLNSTGVETAQSDMCVTGFIPVNYYDTIYLMNIDMKPRRGAVGYNYCYVYLYDENFNRITPGGYITGNNNAFPSASTNLTFDSDGNVTMFKIARGLVFTSLENKTDIRYMRISAQNITSDSIIIKNK